ncbi:MAG TPA: hypothetical protein VLZ83_10990 [Edaphocola sp.]|nr:hypothetical protein [Edaphocola sp.]
MHISYSHIELGSIVLKEKLIKEKLAELSLELKTLGLALIDDRRSRNIEINKTNIFSTKEIPTFTRMGIAIPHKTLSVTVSG